MSKFRMMGNGEIPKKTRAKPSKDKQSKKASAMPETPTITTIRGTDLWDWLMMSQERDSKLFGLVSPKLRANIQDYENSISGICSERLGSQRIGILDVSSGLAASMSFKRINDIILNDYMLHDPVVVRLGSLLLPIIGFRIIDENGFLNFEPNRLCLNTGNQICRASQIFSGEYRLIGRRPFQDE